MNAADIQYGLRQAPPVGRALRILFGVVLIVYVTPVYFRVPVGVCRRVVAADARADWRLQPYPDRCIATDRWPARSSGLGGGLTHRVVCCGRFAVADFWPRKRSASSSRVPRFFVDSRWRACRARLRSDGDPRFALWETHRSVMSHFLAPRQC